MLLAAGHAAAQDTAAPPAPEAAPVPAPAPAPVPAPAPSSTKWEGAIGPIVSHNPAYQGADQATTKVTPGFFIRYGRLTVTNTGGFVTRRADDVLRGLGLDLSRSDRVRVGLQLRYDRGRQEDSADALKGLGDVKSTVRLRLGATWRFDDGWRIGAGWSLDAFARGGGNLGDLGVSREQRLSPDTVWTWGATLNAAGDRYMQSYFGVSEDQAARTGYPVYEAKAGLRDVSLTAGFRTDLSHDWLAIGGIGVSRLLGPAAASPLTKQPTTWGINAGLAWRF